MDAPGPRRSCSWPSFGDEEGTEGSAARDRENLWLAQKRAAADLARVGSRHRRVSARVHRPDGRVLE
jgi:hypothetical protein